MQYHAIPIQLLHCSLSKVSTMCSIKSSVHSYNIGFTFSFSNTVWDNLKVGLGCEEETLAIFQSVVVRMDI